MNLYSQIEANRKRTFFLFFFTFLVILVLGYIFGLYFEDPYAGAIGAFLFSLAYAGSAFFFSDRIVLAISGAKLIEKEDHPLLFRTVENLCIGAGLPIPKIYIMEEKAMNAFATGRDPHHAVVVVTQGLLENLKDEELEGVIAHELSHVRNHDIRVMALAAVLAGSLVIIADIFLRSFRYSGSSRGRSRGGGAGAFLLLGVLLAILAPIFAQLIKLAISRQREFLADSSGALLTRYPEGLATALEKIAVDKTPLRNVSEATAHLYIKNPLTSSFWAGIFSTHPPVEERIQRLRAA
ncbi:MAG: M48 family metallopeptidase [candidate division WWE3 bacterium]|nr:M48 family metallopeptidase [candidate division WWE3 bacterium]